MAAWFIEARSGESWRSVSDLFGDWVEGLGTVKNFGWSEGNSASLPNGTPLLCFNIPDHHGGNVRLFEQWAETTDRLYGLAKGGIVFFPGDPSLTLVLPVTTEAPVPPWLR